jgi:hypothetical protein
MKKLFISTLAIVVFVAACKKKENQISKVAPVSAPTITFTSSQFISIPVGGTLPDIGITAYDSVLHEVDKVNDTGAVDVNTEGLYVKTAYTRNSNGYTTTSAVYIAVTNISASTDISGTYVRLSNGQPINVTKMATGLYWIDNVGGVPPPSDAIIPVAMAQLSDGSFIAPSQPSTEGAVSADDIQFTPGPPDTIRYIVDNPAFGASVRTFVKQ